MKLKQARMRFNEIRLFDERISVRPHAWQDYPERQFTVLELVRLIKGSGSLQDNPYPTAQPNSFLWVCKDDDARKTEIAVVFESNKTEDQLVIIHAYRKI